MITSEEVFKKINKERISQISKGYDSNHDDKHIDGEIAGYADSYLSEYIIGFDHFNDLTSEGINILTKAAACIVAEIERLSRI